MSAGPTLNVVTLPPGARVQTRDGATAEIVENPQDGFWLICRYVAHPTQPQLVGPDEHHVFAQDIVALAP